MTGVGNFSYTAHDASNNTVTGTITIDVTDDVPTARVDIGNVAEVEAADGCGVRGATDERRCRGGRHIAGGGVIREVRAAEAAI